MKNGTLLVSRVETMYPYYARRFKELGFGDITITGNSKDALNMLIAEMEPKLVIISSGFYDAATPYMCGEILRLFPGLNIAVVSLHDYPLSLAPWFIWHGCKSYLSVRDEGYEAFHAGLQDVRRGIPHIAAKVNRIIEHCEWPTKIDHKVTKRQMECLYHLCAGYTPENMGEKMHVTRATVNRTLANLYNIFHVQGREEMVALAWKLEMFNPNDIKFFDDRRYRNFKFPKLEWVEVKRKCDRLIKSMSGEQLAVSS